MDLQPHIEKFAARMAEVEIELGDPKVFENNRRAQELGREYSRLKNLVVKGEQYLKAREELAENQELVDGGDEMAEMAACSKRKWNSASCRRMPRTRAIQLSKFARVPGAMKPRFLSVIYFGCISTLPPPKAGNTS